MSYPLEVPRITAESFGGLYRPWGERGTGVISGTTKVDGVATPCRVSLYQADGMMIDFARTESSGTYSFNGLFAGEYYLVICDDRQSTRRAKVEHIIVT